jgi:WD40 repeat protein
VEVDTAITHLAFAADGATMVFHAGKQVQVWEVVAAKVKNSFDTGAPVVRTAVSADGRTIAVAHEDGTAALHDSGTGKLRFGWKAHPGHQIICLQFIRPKAGKHMLVTAAKKGDVVYWDVSKLRAPETGKKGKGKRKGKRKGNRKR